MLLLLLYVTGQFGGQLAGKALVQALSNSDAVKWSAAYAN
jgi:hypothetical protein